MNESKASSQSNRAFDQRDALRRVAAVARDLLVLHEPTNGHAHIWLWEHTERVARLAQHIALLPEAREVGNEPPDLLTATVAALFHDAGWAIEVQQKKVSHWQVLGRPTNDLQRELGAGALEEMVGELLPERVVDTATRAIRECNDRYSKVLEARVLAEAENLDEIGLMYMLRQFRQTQAEGKPMENLFVTWNRQLEYHYWEARINDCLRWETTRHMARERLKSLEHFMGSLASDAEVSDLRKRLESTGIDTSVIHQRLS